MPRSLIGLGSNEGNRAERLRAAVEALEKTPGSRVIAASRWISSRPVGGPKGQGEFLNGAVVLETSLAPPELFARLENIEQALGRRRDVRWGPRTIDLDLLLYEQEVIDTPRLTVPHPRLAFRRFVLEPAAEIAGDWRHPTIGWTIDRLHCRLSAAPRYVAVVSAEPDAARSLAEPLAARLGGSWLERAGLAHSLGPGSEAQGCVEFVASCRGLLDRFAWRDSAAEVFSDFWIGEAGAWLSLHGEVPDAAQARSEWLSASQVVVQPRLVVWIEAAVSGAGGQRETVDNWSDALRLALSGPDVGPVLRLSLESSDVLDDASAAIEGMR